MARWYLVLMVLLTICQLTPLTTAFSQVYLRGSFNNWVSTPMKRVAPHTWQISAIFSYDPYQMSTFLFDAKGDGSVLYGDNLINGTWGQLSLNGNAIQAVDMGNL